MNSRRKWLMTSRGGTMACDPRSALLLPSPLPSAPLTSPRAGGYHTRAGYGTSHLVGAQGQKGRWHKWHKSLCQANALEHQGPEYPLAQWHSLPSFFEKPRVCPCHLCQLSRAHKFSLFINGFVRKKLAQRARATCAICAIPQGVCNAKRLAPLAFGDNRKTVANLAREDVPRVGLADKGQNWAYPHPLADGGTP